MIETLQKCRATFGRKGRLEKLRLIRTIKCAELKKPDQVRTYHNLLLFLVAYPDNAQLLDIAESELNRIAELARQDRDKGRLTARLANTGIANTELVYPFSIEMAAWLTRRLPNDVEIDLTDDELCKQVDDILHQVVASVEGDGLYTGHLSTKEWFDLAKGDASTSDAQWLVEQFRRLKGPRILREVAFDALNLELHWRLCEKAFSRTTARFPRRPIFFQTKPIHRQVDLESIATKSLRAPAYLSNPRAEALLDTCRTTLCVRRRETDPLTYANPQEVSLFRLERGIDVAIFGMLPDHRLPIESYFGFFVARNRVPIGYGGGWVFFERCEIGVNIFDEFRGGESAFAFAQVIRIFHRFFKSKRFLVDPFQFGANNREAIQSGAFWFYYRLGFRPINAKLNSLAAEEANKLSIDPRHRTTGAILRKLARAKLGLSFANDSKQDLPALDLTQLGLAVTGALGRLYQGDRELAESSCLTDAMRTLQTGSIEEWPSDEQDAFRRLSLLLKPLGEISDWPRLSKTRLLQAIRAKGGPRERDYTLALQAIPEFRESLVDLARTAP